MTAPFDETAVMERLNKAETRISELTHRVDGHERNASDLALSLNQIAKDVVGMGDRLSTIDKDEIEKRIASAVEAEREKQLQHNITTILADLTALKSMNITQIIADVKEIKDNNKNNYRLLLGCIGSIVVGVLVVIIRGGMGV